MFFEQTFGIYINVKILTVIGGVLMVSTAFIGYRAIEKLSLIAVPLLAILLVASLFKVMSHYSFSEVINSPLTTDPLSLGSVISLIIGSLAIGAVMVRIQPLKQLKMQSYLRMLVFSLVMQSS